MWGHLGVTLGSFLAYGGTLEPYLSQFDVEKSEMASVMGICAGLVGPKSENVKKRIGLYRLSRFLNFPTTTQQQQTNNN